MTKCFTVFLGFLLIGGGLFGAPTYGDLAVLLAKGYFKNDVLQDATLQECVSFLNEQGVCFSLFDLMDPSVHVDRESFARAVGQSTLLFLGEADFEKGCVKKPGDIGTWVDYCMLNDVNLDFLWQGFNQKVKDRSLPEVETFFKMEAK